MRLISEVPERSTRQIADMVGISNGSAYYIITTLVKKGFVKLETLKKNHRKGKYAYLLTPKGIREKSLLTHRSIKRKKKEYAELKVEIESLEKEAGLEGEVVKVRYREK